MVKKKNSDIQNPPVELKNKKKIKKNILPVPIDNDNRAPRPPPLEEKKERKKKPNMQVKGNS